MGRQVSLDYREDPTATITGNLDYKFQVIITLPNGKTIVYDKGGIFSDTPGHIVRTNIKGVYDVDMALPITGASKEKYDYYYEWQNFGFTFLNGTNYANQNAYQNITHVSNLKSLEDKFFSYGDINNRMYRFVKPLSYSGYSGSMEYRKVVQVSYKNSFTGTLLRSNSYSYTNEPQGYTFNPSANTWSIYPGYNGNDQAYLANTYRYYTQVTDGRGAKTNYTFNGIGETVNVEKSGNDHKESSTTTYDANKLPQKVQTVTYNVVNGVAGSSITKTDNYLYDAKGNLTRYTGPEASRDPNGNPTGSTYTTPENTTVNEHTVVYTYDPNFSIVTSKTWKQDAATVSRIESTVTSTNGNVTQMRNVHTGNNIVTDFQYNSLGNMTQKKVHYADNGTNTYITNYVYGTEEDGVDRGGTAAKYNGVYYGGAYLTREYATVDGTQISKKYSYDFNTGVKTADFDENNNRTDYTYDLFQRIIAIKYPDQSQKQYTYYDYLGYMDYYGASLNNRVIEYTDQKNNKFRYAYDIFGNLLQYSEKVNEYRWDVLRQLTYDPNNNKTKEMDAYGHSSQFIYDSANRLTQKSFWSDDTWMVKSTTLQYTINTDSNNALLINVTDEDGYIKKNHYDISNRLIQFEVTPDKTNFYATNYTYDYVGHKTSEADALTHATNYTYDDLGRLKSQVDARSHTTQYFYDAGNKLIQQINPRGKSSSYDYDLLGRLIRKKDPASDGTTAVTRTIYDPVGNKTKEISPNYYDSAKDTASLAATMTGTSYTYNSMNRLQSVVSPEGAILEYRSYDGNGNVQKVVDGLRYTGDINTSPGTTYVYDAFNRKTQQTDALGNSQSFTYLLTGQLDTWTDANQNTTSYVYNADGTLQIVFYPDTGYITYSYDKRGYKASETDQRGNTTSYSYNGFGKIGTITDAKQNTIVNAYFNNGNLNSVKDQRGHYTYYSYYADNDLQQKKTSLDASNFSMVNYVTDEVGNITQKTLTGTLDSTSRVTAYTYYDNNLPQTATDTSPQSNSGSYVKNYYDRNKNLIKVEIKRDASNTDVSKYIYDNRDRKIQSIKLVDQADVYNAASLPNLAALQDSGKLQIITGYTYDILGNLTSTIDPRAYGYLTADTANRNLYTITNSYDSLNRLATVTNKVNGTNVSTKYYYDAVGNKKAVKNERGYYTVLTYDSMNRPLTLTDSETDPSLKTYTEAQIISLAGLKTNTLIKSAINGYDPAGNKTSLLDANGYRTNYVYDTLNRLQTVKAPYDPSKPDSATNPYNQVIDEKVYDENSNLIKEIDAKGYLSGSDDSSRYGTEYTYNYANQLVKVLDPEGKVKGVAFTTQYLYNQYGEKTKQTDAVNNPTSFTYNSVGKLLTVTDALSVGVVTSLIMPAISLP
ncbi:YD repeat protein [Desulfosporosinus sp. I2]|uniref:RHS repeat protein n=1 Tax=Desulfosporosinus sp. I2 TaxID=1617025 RepID=UPI0005EDA1CD|nr:RHS repeat protein [Desulfosporosinus sp. I2]KJR44859.1 YD repeat protein [Desulfosporosinus sp. I2]